MFTVYYDCNDYIVQLHLIGSLIVSLVINAFKHRHPEEQEHADEHTVPKGVINDSNINLSLPECRRIKVLKYREGVEEKAHSYIQPFHVSLLENVL